VKADIYTVKICDSALDMVHGMYREILEIHIPNKKIAFNEDSDVFHCFLTNKDRYTSNATKIGEILVPNAMLQAMAEYINISKRLGKTKKWFKRCVGKGTFKVIDDDVKERKVVKKKKKR